ncbi:MurR/RpiR family transcriptional regulator [Clostridium sp. YIM B02515]|uniref:MurR/RpiR family transcriptional regulator n=1 Tax=Clostridium rhizosphaerae TaxID=2803861 RepID=A0ABS1TFL2_9CLOT|nr:MurR/RpiR family transcriptional regulator [Clostridium rhizosphaerae]MBL4937552.1 MurR/RpiR family transcriptional regulator [Clostridium rhizosphaerae]
MDMISTIRNIYSKLSPSEKKVADFVMKNPQQVLNLSIFELADLCNVSAPSVSRFVKRTFGLNFLETKVELAKNFSKIEKNNVTELLSWADDLVDMPSKIINEISLTCNDVITANTTDKFKDVINLIKNADTVYFFAVGSSANVATDFQNKLLKIGIKSIFISDSNLNMLNSNICTPRDVVIAISFSGRTKEVNIAVSNAKKRNTPIVAITQGMDNRLAQMADYVLLSPSYEINENRLGAIFSRYGQLFIVDYLFVGLAKQVIKNTKQFAESYHKLFEILKEDK